MKIIVNDKQYCEELKNKRDKLIDLLCLFEDKTEYKEKRISDCLNLMFELKIESLQELKGE